MTSGNQAEQQQILTQRLAALGQIAAGVVHEINNPRTAVKNAFYLVKSAIPPGAETQRYVNIVDEEIERMARVVSQMYEIFETSSHEVSDIQVNAILEGLLLLTRSRLSTKKAEVCDERGDAVPLLRARASEVTQMLWNPLVNAIQALPEEGGHLTLRTREAEGRVIIEIRDNGGGIGEEDLPHVFEPFFTTKSEGGKENGGMGLGLAITRRLAESCGGKVWLTSAAGEGTCCGIELPVPDKNGEGENWRDLEG